MRPLADRGLDTTNARVLAYLSEQARQLYESANDFHETVCELTDELEGMVRLRRRIDGIEDNRDRFLLENRDVDGTCRWDEGYGQVCGAPTVEGTRWCREHVNVWCGMHDRHALGELSTGPSAWRPYCEECRG